jgi:hypothetical protein
MLYPRAAVERAMKVQEVLLRAMSGELRALPRRRFLLHRRLPCSCPHVGLLGHHHY